MNLLASAATEPARGSTTSSTAAQSSWDPLPASAWNADAARHLFRRAAWTARPEEVDQAVAEGLPRTLERLFPEKASSFPKPHFVVEIEESARETFERIRTADEVEKRKLRKEMRDRFQQSYQELAIKWLQFAAIPANAATEKWILFLGDVYVVAYQKVRNTAWLYQHQDILRQTGFGAAPALTKAVSRSPAMIDYLDLKDNRKNAPNENFARELFELFLLGEGNYSELDIKEAARAFTGYRHAFGRFTLAKGQHDPSRKTVFGKSGPFDGDAIIDLAYEQPSACTYLPQELLRFYLSDTAVPLDQVKTLGDWWQASGFDLRALLHRVFSSQLFYSASYRSNYIKSPIQFYLGLIQDLDLDVAPLPRPVINSLRQMGQMPFNPPNVRGWVGGRNWINSSTLGARRHLVQTLFSPINETTLNADEESELTAARAEGHSHFTFSTERLEDYRTISPRETAERLVRTFLPVSANSLYAETVAKFITGKASGETSLERTRAAFVTLLESPEYQLC